MIEEEVLHRHEADKAKLTKYIESLDKKCKLHFGPSNKYVPPVAKPYKSRDVNAYKKNVVSKDGDELKHAKKHCKFMAGTDVRTDKEGRYYPNITDEVECNKIKRFWDPNAVNRTDKYSKGVCWKSREDRVCGQRVDPRLQKPYHAKFKDMSNIVADSSARCASTNEQDYLDSLLQRKLQLKKGAKSAPAGAEVAWSKEFPGCSLQRQTKYTWDCVKEGTKSVKSANRQKTDYELMNPPNDLPLKEGVEEYLEKWYTGKNAPRTNELHGEGNRCQGNTKAAKAAAEEEENKSPPSPPNRPKIKEYINYRHLNPNKQTDAKILRAAMPSDEVFEKFRRGIDTEKFFEEMEWQQFHRDHSLDEILSPPKNDEFLPSKPQSVVNMIMKQVAMTDSEKRGLLAWHSTGSGKCHAKDSPILMFDGSIKLVQDIVVGDVIMGDDSKPRNVLALGTGEDEMFDIINSDATTHPTTDKYTVNSEHILCLIDTEASTDTDQIVEITVTDFLNLPSERQSQLRGYRTGASFSHRLVQVDPYSVGLWIGDGYSPLMDCRQIPLAYKINDRRIQLQVLAGVIDSIGCLRCLRENQYLILIKNKETADDLVFMCRSLGFKAECTQQQSDSFHLVRISGDSLSDIPVRCEHKKIPLDLEKGTSTTTTLPLILNSIKVRSVGKGTYYGFTLDGNHRYLMGDFTVTHNTCTATGVIDAFWDTDRPIIFASSTDAINSNPDFKFHECALNLFARFRYDGFKGTNKLESLALIAAGFKKRNVKFLSFAKLSHRVERAIEYRKNNHLSASTTILSPHHAKILKGEQYVDLTNAVLIIDEVHNLFKPLANQRAEHEKLEKCILDPTKFPNMKVVILTATPGDSVPDVLKLLNIVRDPKDKPIKFDLEKPDEFKSQIQGLISYLDMSNDTTKFPVVIDKQEFIKAPMSQIQFNRYVEQYASIAASQKNYEALTKANQRNRYWEPARKYSNMLFNFDKDMSLSEFSSKLPRLLEKIQSFPREKQYVYSSFYTKMGYGGHGVNGIAKEMEKIGYTKLTSKEAKDYFKADESLSSMPKKKRYILVINSELGEGGKADKNLHDLLKVYNHPANKHGDLIHVMLASQTYNTALDLKAVRHIHLFEPLVSFADDKQTLGRAARYCSHADLDKDAGEWVIQIHRYMSDFPEIMMGPVKKMRGKKALLDIADVKNIDKMIFDESRERMKELLTIYQCMKDMAVDRLIVGPRLSLPSHHQPLPGKAA